MPANKKGFDLPDLSSPETGDILIAVDVDDTADSADGSSKKLTLSTLASWLASLAQTLTNKILTSPVINTGVSGTAIDTNGTLAANSDTKLATQKAVKTYVDANRAPTDGWISDSDTYAYVSANSFKVAGKDVTARFTKGARVKFTNNSITFYGTVKSSAFSTDTTVTLFANSDYAINNSTISAPYYSYALSPQGYPTVFNFSCSWANTSTNPAIGNGTFTAKFWVQGNVCTVNIHIIGGSTTTWGTGNEYSWSLPANPITSTLGDFTGPALLTQNSTGIETAICVVNGASTMGIVAGTGSFASLRVNTTNPVTWTTNDKFNMTLSYIY